MDAIHERVYRRDEVASGGGVEQRGVVTDAQADVGALVSGVPEVTVDESEF
jgi:hypothetical protein